MRNLFLLVVFISLSFGSNGTLTFHSSPKNVTVEAGNKIELECNAEGAVSLTWSTTATNSDYIVSTQSNESITISTLTISNVTESNAGSYMCNITNGSAFLSLSFDITVEVLPTVIIYPSTINSELDNHLNTFTCQVTPLPSHSIVWYHNDIEVTTTNVFEYTSFDSKYRYSVLNIFANSRSINGTYYCSASTIFVSRNNELVVVNSTKVVYNVLYGVEFTLSFPQAIMATVGQTISLYCLASSSPLPHLTSWFNSSDSVISQTNRTLLSNQIDSNVINSTLTILNVQLSDADIYKCSFENTISKESRTITLIVKYPTTATVFTSTVLANSTDTILLSCQLFGDPLPTNITWLYTYAANNTSPLTNTNFTYTVDNTEIDSRTVISNLTLINVTKEHEGIYTCSGMNGVANFINTSNSAEISLTVQVPPVITAANKSVLYRLPNDTITMSFVIELASPPVNPNDIKWFYVSRNGIQELTNSGHLSISTNRLSLTINSLSFDDEGMYLLSASNPAGGSYAYYTLNIGTTPTISISFNRSVVAMGTPQVTFVCSSQADPPAGVSWMIDDQFTDGKYSLTSLSNGSTLILTINNITLSDDGQYVCVARNVLGSINDTVSLVVQIPPNVTLIPGPVTVLNYSESHQLVCNAYGRPMVSLSWYFLSNSSEEPIKNLTGVIEITTSSYSDGKAQLTTSVLHLLYVTKKQEGVFICRGENNVTNLIHSPEYDTTNLTVQVPPTVSGPDIVIAILNLSITLTFTVTNSSPPVSPNDIQWTFTNATNHTTFIRTDDSSHYSFSPDKLNLTINYVAYEDEGTYQIIASNVAGSDAAQITIDVQTPPSIMSLALNVNALENGNVTLMCVAISEPLYTVQWLNPNGSVISEDNIKYSIITTQGSNYGSLIVHSLSIYDAGDYTCIASNIHGKDNITIDLKVQVTPVFIKSPDNKLTQNGGSVTFSCTVYGYPLPEVLWQKDDVLLSIVPTTNSHFNGYHFTIESNLTLANLNVTSEGEYSCYSFNNLTNIQSSTSDSAQLTVNYPVEISRTLSNETVVEGSTTSFVCEATGRPKPLIIWSDLNGILFDSTHFSISEAYSYNNMTVLYTIMSVLTLRNASALHSNISYNCTAINEAYEYNMTSSTSHLFSITVYIPPYLSSVNGSSIIGVIGKSVVIQFVIYRAYPPVATEMITWSFTSVDNITSPLVPNNDLVISTDKLKLTINNISLSDEGNYTITVSNEGGQSTATIELDVEASPSIMSSTSNVNALENVNVTLMCVAISEPLYTVQWLNPNGSLISEDNIKYSIITTQGSNYGSLIVHSLSIYDAGDYTCIASNVHGKDNITIDLKVQVTPVFIKSPDNKLTQNGGSVTFSCTVYGYPLPEVLWQKDDKLLSIVPTTNSHFNGYHFTIESNLTLMNLNVTNEGMYSCYSFNNLTNILSSTSDSAQLTVNYPVEISRTLSNETVVEGSTTSFVCEATGRPKPLIIWSDPNGILFNSTHFSISEAYSYNNMTVLYTIMSVLTLRNASALHSNISYNCTAINEAYEYNMTSSTSHLFSITVYIPPYLSSVNGSSIIGVIGKSVVIQFVIYRAYPPVATEMITWSFTSVDNITSPLVPNNDLVISTDKLKLTINNISLSNEGNYTITVSNEGGQSTATIEFDVEAPPYIRAGPKQLLVFLDSVVNISCSAVAEPIHSITWEFNGTIITTGTPSNNSEESNKYSVVQDIQSLDYGTLTISDIDYNDIGNYTCIATNSHGYDTSTIELILLVPAMISYTPSEVIPLFGGNFTLNFRILNIPFPLVSVSDIYWYNSAGLLLNDTRYIYNVTSNVISLTITNAMVNDAGTYNLTIQTIAGTISELTELIQIYASPLIYNTSNFSSLLADDGESVSLNCIADGLPVPNILWFYNNRILDNSKRITIGPIANASSIRNGVPAISSVLNVIDLNQYDNGTYVCEARNRFGFVRMEVSIRVRPKYINYCDPNPCENGGVCTNSQSTFVCLCAKGYTGIVCSEIALERTPPKIIELSETIYQAYETNVTLKCIVSGYPQPDITWFKDGHEVEGVKSQTYFIEELTLESRGLYKCFASNELGNVTSGNIYVKIRGLVQYRVEFIFTREFILNEIVTVEIKREIDEGLFAVTDERLNKILNILNSHIISELTYKDARFFDMQLLPMNITSLLEPIPFLLTLVSNIPADHDLLDVIQSSLANFTRFLAETYKVDKVATPDSIVRFDGCVAEVTRYPPPDNPHLNELDFIFTWVETDISQSYSLRCPCGPEGFDIGVTRNVTRHCIGNFQEGAKWEPLDYTNCSNFTTNTRRICNLALLSEADEIVNGLDNITADVTNIGSLDITVSTVFVEDLTTNVSGSANLTNSYLSVIDNLISTKESLLIDSNEEAKTSGRLLSSFEDVVRSYPVNDTTVLSLSKYTVLLQELSINESDIDDDLAIGNFEDYNASIVLPSSILNSIRSGRFGNNSSSVRIIQAFFETTSLFLRRQSLIDDNRYLRVGSVLVSASIANESINGLSEWVNITFAKDKALERNASSFHCSFWEPQKDDGYGNWSGEGCVLVENNTDEVVCSCNHLTTFVLLMDVSPKQEPAPPGYIEFLTSVSYVGCCVSIVCLLIIIFTYSIERKLRKTTNGKLLINLCIALLGLYIVFIPAIYAVPVLPLCVTFSALLHYFFLASFLSMASEATVLYLELVQVFSKGHKCLILKVILITWLTPLFIVGFSLAPDYKGYVTDQFCRPVGMQFYIGYILPFAVIYIYNWIMFLIIIISICKQQFKIKQATGNANLQATPKQQFLLLTTLSILFGLGWGVGLAATNQFPVQWLRYSFQIVFVVLISTQGIFIFFFYCLRLKKVRRVWLKWLYIITNQQKKAAIVDNTLKSTYTASSRLKQQPAYNLGSFGDNSIEMKDYVQKPSVSPSSSGSGGPTNKDVADLEHPITDETVEKVFSPGYESTTFKTPTELESNEKKLEPEDTNINELKQPVTDKTVDKVFSSGYESTTFKTPMELESNSNGKNPRHSLIMKRHKALEQSTSTYSELEMEPV